MHVCKWVNLCIMNIGVFIKNHMLAQIMIFKNTQIYNFDVKLSKTQVTVFIGENTNSKSVNFQFFEILFNSCNSVI